MTADPFGIRLAAQVRTVGNAVVVGLDPNPELIPNRFFGGTASAQGVLRFCNAVMNAVAGLVPVVKLQSAYFEIFGAEGIRALQAAASEASSRGFVVIVDAKRGDIGESSAAYAEAYLGQNAFIHCDAMTLHPYLGWDSLEPFFRVALEQNKGVFVCAQTSNPGARDLQSAVVGNKTVYQLVAEHVSARDRLPEPSLGVVVGATFPETAAELRKLGARCWFLVPGIGAQGGSLDTIDRFFRPDGLGALLSSSRSVIFPHRFGNAIEWSEQAVRDATEALILAIKPRN